MEYFLARQAIFDSKQKVLGYEISFRSSLNDKQLLKPEDDQTTSQVINEVFFLIGKDALTGGKRAFIRFSTNLILNGLPQLFPKHALAIEISNPSQPDEIFIKACRHLKKEGYPIVIETAEIINDFPALSEYVSMVKCDFNKLEQWQVEAISATTQLTGLKFLAFNVNTMFDFQRAVELGFDYFQGSFFSKPFVLAGREIPGFKLNYLQMMKELYKPDVSFPRLEAIIKRDVSLSYKLLRMINSAAYGFRHEITSIMQALVLLGTREIRQWITLVVMSNMGNDKPNELISSCLFRAKFCETLAPHIRRADVADDLFLMGMFSLIDAIIPQTLSEILSGIPLSTDIKQALLGQSGPFREVLDLVIAYEKGEWAKVTEQAAKIKLEEVKLPDIFLESIEWAQKVLSTS